MDLLLHRWREEEYELSEGEVYPEYAGMVVARHVGLRSAHVGLCAGLLVAPFWQWYRGQNLLGTGMRRGVVWATVTGGLAGLGLTIARFSQLDEEGVEDRAYRIIHNKNQEVLDDYAFLGGSMGAVAGSIITGTPVGGMVAGLGVGLLLAADELVVFPKFFPELVAPMERLRAGLPSPLLATVPPKSTSSEEPAERV